jgi:hypothetical protein
MGWAILAKGALSRIAALPLLPVSITLGALLPLGPPGIEPGAWAAEEQPSPRQPAGPPLLLTCSEGPLSPDRGMVRAENNAWGKGKLKGWRQCIGLASHGPGQGVTARWTWDWLDAGDNVKAYPELIVGTKPGSAPTTRSLPRRLSQLGQLQARLDLESRRNGSGNLAFDLWLTTTASPSHFGVPPISHELMIWRDAFGSMQPAGQRRATVRIDGRIYDLYVKDRHGDGWRYIAYVPRAFGVNPATRAAGRFRDTAKINLKAFLEDGLARKLFSGKAFLASVELGNELISGQGETLVHHYSLAIK